MALFDRKCANCGSSYSANASFCPQCGQPVGGGKLICGSCRTENQSGARFCRNCGKSLEVSASAQIYSHHWARGEKDFAVRVEASDLPGLFKKGIKVEPGTNALFIHMGASRGVVPPGTYTMSSLPEQIADWITGDVPERVTILLVDVTPTDLEFHLGGRFSQDGLPIGMSVRIQVEVNDPGKFLVNMLKGNQRLSIDGLRQYLYPEVIQVVDAWLRRYTLQQLTEDIQLPQRIELALDEALKRTFAQSGLHFLQVRALELNLEVYDHLKQVRSKYTLQTQEMEADTEGKVTLAEAELSAKRRFAEIQRQIDLDKLAEETQKVDDEERRADLYQRMRQSVMSDRMNEVRSEADFARFLEEQDFEKVLREKERADLRRAWAEEAADHDKARAHLIGKLEIERTYELRLAELKMRTDLSEQELDIEIRLARKRFDHETEMKRKVFEEEMRMEQERDRIARERAEADLSLQRMRDEQERAGDAADAELGMKILAEMKRLRRLDEEETLRIRREDELVRMKADLERQIAMMEAQERQRDAERRHELQKIEAMGKLGTAALVAMSGPEQGRILADLARSEALKGMSEDQILALAAKDSPQVAQALEAKYRAIVDGQASKETRDMYERLLAEQSDHLRRLQEESDKRARELSEAWDKSSERSRQTADRAMDRMADTAKAFADGRGGRSEGPQVIVVPGAGGPQIISGTPGTAQQPPAHPEGEKTCPKCGRSVPEAARHCQYCGNKFEGV